MPIVEIYKFRDDFLDTYIADLNKETKFVVSDYDNHFMIRELARDIVDHYRTGIRLDFRILDKSENSVPWTCLEEIALQGELIVALTEVGSFPRPIENSKQSSRKDL